MGHLVRRSDPSRPSNKTTGIAPSVYVTLIDRHCIRFYRSEDTDFQLLPKTDEVHRTVTCHKVWHVEIDPFLSVSGGLQTESEGVKMKRSKINDLVQFFGLLSVTYSFIWHRVLSSMTSVYRLLTLVSLLSSMKPVETFCRCDPCNRKFEGNPRDICFHKLLVFGLSNHYFSLFKTERFLVISKTPDTDTGWLTLES